MQKGYKTYQVRVTVRGLRTFVKARGYRDAKRIANRFDGKVV